MDPSPTAPRLEYPLSQAPADIQRLIARVSRRNPSTRALLIQAGIVPGMRVLDAGSGAGDVAMMVAELVGPTGAVVGIDLNADSLEVARSRAKAASLDNVSFQIGDAQDISAFDKAETFDAVVGRLVLMYTRDPAQTLRGLVTAVRSGGVVVFQEIDFTTIGWKMHPEGPLYRKANTWLCEGFRQMGAHPSMGYELHATFRAARLPPPELRMDALIGAGPAWDL